MYPEDARRPIRGMLLCPQLGRTTSRGRNSVTRRLKRFRFGIVLTAAVVAAAALAAGPAMSHTMTVALQPVANGNYIGWFGDIQDVDETSNFNCGGNDSIGKGGADPDRESFTVDISSVPIGAMITSVAAMVRDGASPADVGGTYQTFVRINTTDTNSGVNLAATAELFDECSETKTQTIDVPDVVKSATTTLEIGVVKTPPDGSAIRVGTITATVTYNQPPSPPTLSSPADGSTIVDTTPTFDWSDATDPDTGDAVTYDLQADNSDCDFLSPELNETGLAASTFTPGSPLIPGIYCWRARAVDDGNLASDWSGTRTLTVADPPTLFVITHVVNDDGGTLGPSDFTMSVTATHPTPASFPGEGPPGRTVTLDPGNYSVGITPNGYVITNFSADCGGTIAAGETKTCTVTANDRPTRGTLRVITHVVNDDGGTLGPSDFTMSVTATHPTPASFPGEGPPGRTVTLDPGNYSVGITPNGYVITNFSADCGGTIAAGETKTCTVTANDRPTRGTLRVITHVVNDDGGTLGPSDFTMSVTATHPTPASFPGEGPPGRTVTLDPGNYSVGITPNGYVITNFSADCGGTIAAGETKTCTVTADDQPPAVPTCDGLPAEIVGGPGSSELVGTSGDDVIVDLDGDNVVRGFGGDDTVCTGPGNDRILVGGGGDTVIDTGGNNIVDGGAGNDTIRTAAGADTIRAGGGNDIVIDTGGDNTIDAGAGNDTVTTAGGNDTVNGGAGADTVTAGDGNNTINGQAGPDVLTAGAGNDGIDGGVGFDTCAPGAGANVVVRCEAFA